ncbi:hypothetical protein [Streptomyces sp. NPDC058613]
MDNRTLTPCQPATKYQDIFTGFAAFAAFAEGEADCVPAAPV